jgi:hypothetical protein
MEVEDTVSLTRLDDCFKVIAQKNMHWPFLEGITVITDVPESLLISRITPMGFFVCTLLFTA